MTESRACWWAPLRHVTYRNLWVFSCVSALGALVQMTGAAWMMASFGVSATMVALVSVCATLPPVLLSIPAGAMADSWDRRKIMLVAQSFMMIASLLLAVLTFIGRIDATSLLLFTFLIACGQAINTPAWMASISDLVPRKDLPGAIMLNSVGFNVMRTAGPGVGGVILAVGGPSAAFAVNALSYVGEIVALQRWREDDKLRAKARPPKLLSTFGGAFRLAAQPAMRKIIVTSALFGLVASALPTLLPVIVRSTMGAGAVAFGLCLATFGIGALVAGLNGGAIRERLGQHSMTALSFVLTAAGCWLASLFPNLLIPVALAMGFAGAGWVSGFAGITVETQMSATPGSEGRSLALFQLAAFVGLSSGSLGWGVAADATSLPTSLAIAAGGCVISLLLIRPWRRKGVTS